MYFKCYLSVLLLICKPDRFVLAAKSSEICKGNSWQDFSAQKETSIREKKIGINIITDSHYQ